MFIDQTENIFSGPITQKKISSNLNKIFEKQLINLQRNKFGKDKKLHYIILQMGESADADYPKLRVCPGAPST